MQNPAENQLLQPLNLWKIFQGTWVLQRKIINHLYLDLSGVVSGSAHFLPSANPRELNYYESGENQQNNGSVLKVYYASIYRFDSEFKIKNLSSLRTPLFEFNLHEQCKNHFIAPPAIHHCKYDIYTAVLELPKPTEFQLKLDVKGPNKNYTTMTIFRRCATLLGTCAK
jgi:hypothetical protein